MVSYLQIAFFQVNNAWHVSKDSVQDYYYVLVPPHGGWCGLCIDIYKLSDMGVSIQCDRTSGVVCRVYLVVINRLCISISDSEILSSEQEASPRSGKDTKELCGQSNEEWLVCTGR